MAYSGMYKIYKENISVFPMAVAHLIDIGLRKAKTITDEDISGMEENGLMTKEFVQDLVRTTRDIALECGNNAVEVIQFCMATEIFDVEWYKGGDEDEGF